MLNVAEYSTLLWIYIFVICIVAAILFLVGNLLFLILSVSKIFKEKKIWVLSNLVGVILLLLFVVPPMADITFSTYCYIENVTEIEFKSETFSRYDKTGNHTLLVTAKDGIVYTCYDYLVDTDTLLNGKLPQTVVITKYSKLLIDYSYDK